MTVHLKTEKTKSGAVWFSASKPVDVDILAVDPLQQGQALLVAKKKRKKQQKRAGISSLNPLISCIFAFQNLIYHIMQSAKNCHVVQIKLYKKNYESKHILNVLACLDSYFSLCFIL